MAKKAADEGFANLCNQGLVRTAPMAIFATNMLQMSDIKEAILADLNFTHSNPVVQDACFIYGACVHYLLNYVTDPLRA